MGFPRVSGMRGSVLRGWAVILEPRVSSVGAFKLKRRKGSLYRKHFLQLDGLGVRVRGDRELVRAFEVDSIKGPAIFQRRANLIRIDVEVTFQFLDQRADAGFVDPNHQVDIARCARQPIDSARGRSSDHVVHLKPVENLDQAGQGLLRWVHDDWRQIASEP